MHAPKFSNSKMEMEMRNFIKNYILRIRGNERNNKQRIDEDIGKECRGDNNKGRIRGGFGVNVKVKKEAKSVCRI